MADENREIEGGGVLTPRVKPGSDGPGGIAVGAENYGGDTLCDLSFGERIFVEAFGGVVVNVDEAGSEDEALCVDDGLAFLWLEVADGDDAVTGYADIDFAKRSASAVSDLGIDDDGGGGFFLCDRGNEGQGGGEKEEDGEVLGGAKHLNSSKRHRTQRSTTHVYTNSKRRGK